MARVSIYTLAACPFCIRAKALLESRGQPYDETDVTVDRAARLEVCDRTGHPTFPQIFIEGRFIGGYDELQALERAGRLDALLA